MAELIRMNTTFNVRPDLVGDGADVVLHRTGDLLYGIEAGRELASLVTGARIVELEVTDHLPYFEDADRILDLIEAS